MSAVCRVSDRVPSPRQGCRHGVESRRPQPSPQRSRTSRPVLGITAILALLGGCAGSVDTAAGTTEPGGPGASGAGNVGGAGTSGGTGAVGAGNTGTGTGGAGTPIAKDAVGPAADFSGKPSALRRLTRDELVTTLMQLTGSSPARAALPEEPRGGHGPLLTGGVSFVAVEVEKLREVLGTFARTIAATMLTGSGCRKLDAAQAACLADWYVGFAERAFRRSLRPGEGDLLKAIFAGATGVAAVDTDVMESGLTAVFFSPSFLYRTEVGTPVTGKPGVRALTGDEVMAKLSFLATLGAPDATLLDVARSGKLSDAAERGRQFARLANTPAGAHAQAVMILEWLGANESKFGTKAQKYVDGLSAGTEMDLRASAEKAIASVLASPDGATLANLLTTDAYLKDPVVAQITRAGNGGGVVTGDTVDQPRLGLLLHPHVIASHTKDNGSSPFGIGAFVKEAILCQPIPPPPPGATNMTRNDPPAGLSMREDLEYRTSAGPVCIACHSQFAPVGFSFMPFDPVGRWIKQDPSTKPWVLAGTTSLYRGDSLAFDSPSALVKNLSKEKQVYGCFAQTALQWILGRKLMQEDEPLVARLDGLAKSSSANIPKLLQTVIEDPSFSTALAAR